MQDKTTTAGEFNPLEMKPTNIEMHEEYVDVQLRLPIEVSARDVAIRFNAAMKGTPGYEGYEATVINGEVHIVDKLKELEGKFLGGIPKGELMIFGAGGGGKSHMKQLIEGIAQIEANVVDIGLMPDTSPKAKAQQLRKNVLGPKKGRWA